MLQNNQVRTYELFFAFKISKSNTEIANDIKNMAKENLISEIINIEYLGLRSIPLKNRKSERIHAVCVYYQNTQQAQDKLRFQLTIREDVIRFCMIKIHHVRNAPSHLHKSDYPMFKYTYTEEANDQEIYYHNVDYLKKFTTTRGKILSARINRVSASVQKKITREIKRARSCGLIPFMSE